MDQNLLNELTDLKGKLDKCRPLDKDQVAALEKQVRYEHVWSSNSIEGNSLTKYETIEILDRGMTVHGASVKDTLEAIDLNDAYEYMMDLASKKQPLTQTIIRDINRLATMKTATDSSNAGVYRAIQVAPKYLEDHPYVEPFEIRPKMDDLITWSNEAQVNLHPVQYAADLHQKFVSIHPFVDGNGRTARLLMNMALTENGYPVINVQPDQKARTAYMEALEKSRMTGDLTAFEDLIGSYSKKALKDRIATLELNEENQRTAKEETHLSKDHLRELYKSQRNQSGLER